MKKQKKFILALAPMAGYTDLAFRRLASQYELDWSTTEMVSAKALFYGDKKTKSLMKVAPDEAKVSLQLFGEDPEIMGKVIGDLSQNPLPYESFDINMGCPAPKIVKSGAGSALLNDLERGKRMMEEAVKNSSIPISIKVRKGFLEGETTGLAMAKAAQEMGISWITVHGRSREAYYSGHSDWDFIGEVAEEINIPVIANGDIKTPEDAHFFYEKTRCQGIAIGRGAVGKPYIFKQLKESLKGNPISEYSLSEQIQMGREQLVMTLEDKDERLAILEMRKHFIHYFRGIPDAKKIRDRLMTLKTKEEVLEFVEEIYRKNGGNIDK